LAVALTMYVALGMRLEERDLAVEHGPALAEWARHTPALVPGLGRRSATQTCDRDRHEGTSRDGNPF
jgi:hypothetical protein